MVEPDVSDNFESSNLWARREMIERDVKPRGVRDARVLAALEAVPREAFLPDALKPHAYEDRALGIDCGQTISQPFIVAYMTSLLEVESTHDVLEIGTGSGYQAAVLARLARRVYSVERLQELSEQAGRVLKALHVENVTLAQGDGTLGWPLHAPYDRIIVTAAAPKLPKELMNQLKEEGVLVAPIGPPDRQHIVKARRRGDRILQEALLACRFVKLIGQNGWREEV